jgi:phosphoribosyl-dephospho-CoA transferase
MQGFRRHDLVWLDPDTDMALLALDAAHAEHVRGWIQNNWPLVVARQADEAARLAGQLQLGITLPSAPSRTRIALRAPQAGIISYSRPLPLQEAIAYAPSAWREQLSAVAAICAGHAVVARVYGSLSTQEFTRQNYLDAASDVDVLFECSKDTQLQTLFAELHALGDTTPQLDGEVLAPNGWAVAWREVAAALQTPQPAQLLAKSYTTTRLLGIAQLFDNSLFAT